MLARIGLVVLVIILALILVPNARSLYEGLFFYIPDAISHLVLS